MRKPEIERLSVRWFHGVFIFGVASEAALAKCGPFVWNSWSLKMSCCSPVSSKCPSSLWKLWRGCLTVWETGSEEASQMIGSHFRVASHLGTPAFSIQNIHGYLSPCVTLTYPIRIIICMHPSSLRKRLLIFLSPSAGFKPTT